MSTQIISPMLVKRSIATAASIDKESFIAIGGRGESFEALSSCEIYDGSTNQWTRLPQDMPEGRSDCGAATIDGHVYVVGGRNMYMETMSSMVAYSLDAKRWISKRAMKDIRNEFAAVASNGRLFVFGGLPCFTEVMNPAGRALSTSEVYDPETNRWKDLPPMSQPRFWSSAATVDDKIYVIGGRDLPDDVLSSVEILNVTTEQWEKGPDMPTARFSHTALTIGRCIVVIGGFDGKHHYSSTHIYNVDEKKWSDGPPLTTARSLHVAGNLGGNRVAVAGGRKISDNCLNTAEAITFHLGGTSRVNQTANNETNSIVPRTKVLEQELGLDTEGSSKEKIEHMEKLIYGSIKIGALNVRLEKLKTDITG